MFDSAKPKNEAPERSHARARTAHAIPALDQPGAPWTSARGKQFLITQRFYPLVSIPAFLGLSLIVTFALVLAVVALIFTAALRFALRIAGLLAFRSSRSSYGTRQLSVLSKENVS
jgi:hypothetical protein